MREAVNTLSGKVLMGKYQEMDYNKITRPAAGKSICVGKVYVINSKSPWQPVVLVDFCTTSTAKIPINRRALGVCKVKNRLQGDFWRFYARSATNSYVQTDGPAKHQNLPPNPSTGGISGGGKRGTFPSPGKPPLA
jgi:hypothetical protein